MKRNITKLIIVAVLFCSYNFTAFSQATVSFETITEALNYNGDRDTVKKLIITGSISGNDYSPTSEWSKFRTLDTTFPNIEEVEILTSQDIPDAMEEERSGFFIYFDDDIDEPIISGWLKRFSAPNIKNIGWSAFAYCINLSSADFPLATAIGDHAFSGCRNLSSVDFPLVTTIGSNAFGDCINLSSADFPLVTEIGDYAFADCENLIAIDFPLVTEIGNWAFVDCIGLASINFPLAKTIKNGAFAACENLTIIDFPLVTNIRGGAFAGCKNLTSATFGTDFTMPTWIDFSYYAVFGSGDILTKNIDLTLGEYVLPVPDLTTKTWQSDHLTVADDPYVWKSITIKTSSIEELVRNSVVNIFPNPTSDNNFTISFELEKSCNMKIVLCDVLGQELAEVYDGFTSEGLFTRTHSTEHLAKGVYFLKILLDGNIVVEKIIVE